MAGVIRGGGAKTIHPFGDLSLGARVPQIITHVDVSKVLLAAARAALTKRE
jgi:hypothetical protein